MANGNLINAPFAVGAETPTPKIYLLWMIEVAMKELDSPYIYVCVCVCVCVRILHSFTLSGKKKKFDKFIHSFEILALKVSYPNQMEEIN